MRLWSLHPCYLDAKGLVALWREGLLAQKVLQGKTRGYKNHPQLIRFKKSTNPLGAIATYLQCVCDEADARGYAFDRSKIVKKRCLTTLPVTSGQLAYEFEHLLKKLKIRDTPQYRRCKDIGRIATHPLFKKQRGNVADWEIV